MTKHQKPQQHAGNLGVPKTFKLFIGGAFPRSESGRTTEFTEDDGTFVANVARASRKDAREAVVAARKAFPRWSIATAYNRGQVLYRIAEVLDGRRAQFEAELATIGRSAAQARAEVDEAIATWVYFAGFADKFAHVVGSSNPVASPYFNFSLPEPVGVVAAVAPSGADESLVGIARVLAPKLAPGNAVVLVASPANPCSAISFAEVLATSDVPGGAVNVLTGDSAELAPVLASHMDVNAIDLVGLADGAAAECERAAAENLKRVLRPRDISSRTGSSLDEITACTELKTVWHPIGV